MSRWIRFHCAGCGARIKAPPELAGCRRPCPGCGWPLLVRPEPPPEDSGPLLLREEAAAVGRRRLQGVRL